MIVDNLKYIMLKKSKSFGKKRNKDKIKLFYLPPYSPEFNLMNKIKIIKSNVHSH